MRSRALLVLVFAIVGLSTDVRAQDAPPVPATPEPELVETVGPVRPSVSPGGAFLRSLILPGWGQAAYDSNVRGAVYFAGQLGNAFMLVKTVAKLDEARSVEAHRVEEAAAAARESLLQQAEEDEALRQRYEEDPLQFERDVLTRVDEDEGVVGIRSLVRARKQQREDWIAWTLFWTLASGIDAFVNAHLSDFPAGIVAEPSAQGGVSMGLTLPLPRAR